MSESESSHKNDKKQGTKKKSKKVQNKKKNAIKENNKKILKNITLIINK